MKRLNDNLDYIRSLNPKDDRPVQTKAVLLLNHSMEAPDKPNIARSLAKGWFRNPAAQVSVHACVDRTEAIQTFPFGMRCWGCGTGNDYVVVQTEHVGYAGWSKAQWTTSAMKRVMRNSARHQAWCWVEAGQPGHPQWLSLGEIRAGKSGLCTHNDARLVWGGTPHTDPGPNFPYALLAKYIAEEVDRLRGVKPAPTPVTKAYTVKRGDTLSGIAYRYRTTVAALVKLNNIKDPDRIYIGQKIKLSGGVPVAKPSKPYTPPPNGGRWPLQPGNFFGDIRGPAKSHGGYYASERPYVKWIQIRLHELGYAPGGSWADGKYEQPTVDAVAKWQRDRHAKTTTLYGQVWADDYRNLQKDR